MIMKECGSRPETCCLRSIKKALSIALCVLSISSCQYVTIYYDSSMWWIRTNRGWLCIILCMMNHSPPIYEIITRVFHLIGGVCWTRKEGHSRIHHRLNLTYFLLIGDIIISIRCNKKYTAQRKTQRKNNNKWKWYQRYL